MIDGTKYVRLCYWRQKQSTIQSYPFNNNIRKLEKNFHPLNRILFKIAEKPNFHIEVMRLTVIEFQECVTFHGIIEFAVVRSVANAQNI